jgi:hypothetical protein
MEKAFDVKPQKLLYKEDRDKCFQKCVFLMLVKMYHYTI